MPSISPGQRHRIETALLCAAVRCAWGAAARDDRKLLSMAVKAAGDNLIGTPAYHLALAGAGFLSGAEHMPADMLGAAVLLYCHEMLPPAEPDPDPDIEPDPDPESEPGRSWEREHGLIG